MSIWSVFRRELRLRQKSILAEAARGSLIGSVASRGERGSLIGSVAGQVRARGASPAALLTARRGRPRRRFSLGPLITIGSLTPRAADGGWLAGRKRRGLGLGKEGRGVSLRQLHIFKKYKKKKIVLGFGC